MMTPSRVVHDSRLFALIVGAAAMLVACPSQSNSHSGASQSASASTPPCDSGTASGSLTRGTTLGGRAGRYDLLLRATSGSRAGAESRGTLVLHATTRASMGGVVFPLSGTSDIHVDLVGASTAGSMTSADPKRPGVLVMEYPRTSDATGARDITIRFGADANDASAQQFDGAVTALHVASVTPVGFSGRWNSSVDATRASGYFCAWKVAESR